MWFDYDLQVWIHRGGGGVTIILEIIAAPARTKESHLVSDQAVQKVDRETCNKH